ncbi:putative amidase C869.01 [Ananas comosus]|uniref:Amidase C869.01 n=1 Tax=Ananas comosus TaxID=4615 RepID=A0A6P5FSR5_ANACO|nr:putative amidase C869.01 [Ananas comosus]
MAPPRPPSPLSPPQFIIVVVVVAIVLPTISGRGFEIEEATIDGIHRAFESGELTAAQLVGYYLDRIRALNPAVRAVVEADRAGALDRAARLDRAGWAGPVRGLRGIPVLLKDNIGTGTGTGARLNTTAGSLALLGAAPRGSGAARRLRRAGAVVVGKASLSEWAHFRSFTAPNGWSARGGQGRNPYVLSADPCGSSSGSAIAVAANMVAVALGTETDGSIICPAAANSVVGIKPTVGLTSRAGVIPISPRQDTVGPICRTVSDAVHVLDAIVGYDPDDAEATKLASKYIPQGGYKQFLNLEGLKGKRLGILRKGFFEFPPNSVQKKVFEEHFNTMRQRGAILIDNLEIANVSIILDSEQSGESIAMLAEFKLSLNTYLAQLSYSPVRSLEDVIAFNNKHKIKERMKEYGQPIFLRAQKTSGIGPVERSAILRMNQLSKEGIEMLMMKNQLDAVITPDATATSILAIGGYPGISVPAGYDKAGVPFGICFGGLKGSEPKLIEIAYAFEQATAVRKPPTFKSSLTAKSKLTTEC